MWRVELDPRKSQQMYITRRRNEPRLPTRSFLNQTVQTKDCMKLLGVTFDREPSLGHHLHRTSVRAHQRLHFLRKAAPVLDSRGITTVDKRFVRPLIWYIAIIVWLCAVPTHLANLDTVQACALRIVGQTNALQIMHAR